MWYSSRLLSLPLMGVAEPWGIYVIIDDSDPLTLGDEQYDARSDS
jgi:hypothetical protein